MDLSQDNANARPLDVTASASHTGPEGTDEKEFHRQQVDLLVNNLEFPHLRRSAKAKLIAAGALVTADLIGALKKPWGLPMNVAKDIGKILCAHGEPGIQALIEHLHSRSPKPTLLAFLSALQTVGPRAKTAVEMVFAILSSRDAAVRREALKALEFIGCASRIGSSRLKMALRDKDPTVRIAAARTWVRVMRPDDLVALVPMIKDPEPKVRVAVLATIDKLGHKARIVLNDMGVALWDAHPAVRETAVRSVARVGKGLTSVYSRLCDMTLDPDDRVRAVANQVVWELGDDTQSRRRSRAARHIRLGGGHPHA